MGEYERFEKCRKMMISCKTKRQLENAVKWVNLLVVVYGGFSMHYAMSIITIRGVMMERLGVVNEDVTIVSWDNKPFESESR